jgi:heat shock protein HslJ/uncharacterized lipoprotein NlpE involved in copper resistance
MLHDRMAFGHTADGQPLAAVVLITDPGGSGTFRYLSAVVRQDGEMVNVATTLLGDRAQIKSLGVEGDEIVVEMITHGPDDPMCCPTQRVQKSYALTGDQLVETASEILGTESDGTETPDQTAWIGIYKGWSRAASSPGIDSTLYLNADNSLKLVDDYLNNEPPIVEVGTWQASSDDAAVLTVTGQETRAYDTPKTVAVTRLDDTLATAEGEDAYGQLGRQWIRFDTVARDQAALPYDAAAGSRAIEASGFVGIYKAILPAATCCGRDISLILSPDNTAQLKTDYLNNEPPIVEIGTWETNDDESLTLTLTGQESRTYDAPKEVTFEATDGTLVAVEYDESTYGAGLTLYHFDGLVAAGLPPAEGSALEGPVWQLVSYGDPSAPQAVLEGTEITISFDGAEKGFSGSAGCNSYFGSYESDDGDLTLGAIGMTEMYCAPETRMDQESAYLAALESAASYRIADGQLQIASADGETALTFSVLEPAPLTGTPWGLNGYHDGQDGFVSLLSGTEITALFGDGQVAGSAGCNNYTASYTVEDGAITFGPAAATRKACAEPEGIMAQESAYLAALESATAYQIEGDALTLTNAEGVRVAAFTVFDAEAAEASGVMGETWQWVGTQTPTEQISVDDPAKYTIQFLPGGEAHVQADCNVAGGTYTIEDSHITITITTTTLAACPEGSLGDEFIKELNEAVIYLFEGDDLLIDRIYDSGTMRFVKGG